MCRVLVLFADYFALLFHESLNRYHSRQVNENTDVTRAYNKNQSEIAKIMGVNQSTVSQILKQAIETSSPLQTEREDVEERGRLQHEILPNCCDRVQKIQDQQRAQERLTPIYSGCEIKHSEPEVNLIPTNG